MQPDGPGSMVREYVEKAEEDLRAADALRREGSLDALVCAVLADFAVAPRYPGWEAGAGGVDSAEALAAARTALVLLRPLVFSEGPE